MHFLPTSHEGRPFNPHFWGKISLGVNVPIHAFGVFKMLWE